MNTNFDFDSYKNLVGHAVGDELTPFYECLTALRETSDALSDAYDKAFTDDFMKRIEDICRKVFEDCAKQYENGTEYEYEYSNGYNDGWEEHAERVRDFIWGAGFREKVPYKVMAILFLPPSELDTEIGEKCINVGDMVTINGLDAVEYVVTRIESNGKLWLMDRSGEFCTSCCGYVTKTGRKNEAIANMICN